MLIQKSTGSTRDSFRGFSKEELNTTNVKMEQQQQHLQHIKRLLSTAAAGTGIVGDLDAPSAQHLATLRRKGERNLWRLDEIKEMLTIMQEINALDLLNDKMIKSESVFHDIEKVMIRRGYNKKTHNQIWTKWKFLKSTYMTSRRNGLIPKMIPGEIYLLLHKMLGNGLDMQYKFEDSSNAASLDGDQSMADEELENSLISNSDDHVKSKIMPTTAAAEKPAAFGMAHPIFGFRLGMVKSEPADTGYETTANNSVISENDSLENCAIFPVEISPQDSQDIKPEPDERVTDSPEAMAPATILQNHSPSPEADNSLLVPRETDAMSIRPLAVKQKFTPTRGSATTTALRIAPFAKEANMSDALTPNECPPPTLRTNKAKQTTEVNTSNAGSVFSISPAITIGGATSRGSILRLPRDVTLQLRTNYPHQTNTQYPQKPNPMQKVPSAYALRAEERSVNRSQISSATQLSSQHTHQQPQEQPMTSQMAKLRASILNKKRRLEIPNWEATDSQPTPKAPRLVNPSNLASSSTMRNNSYHANKSKHVTAEDHGHDDDDDYEEDDYGAQTYAPALFPRSRSFEQQYIPAPVQKPKTPPSSSVPPPQAAASTPKTTKTRTPMEEVLKDMAMSLRQSQLQMVNDFFEQQMELARKEHEFQMEQDLLMMAAFRKQSLQLMQAAQELFGAGAGTNGSSNMTAMKNKPSERLKSTTPNNKPKIANPRKRDQVLSQHLELSSSDSDELQENGDSDPLLSAFDPTQFVSSELVETNDENDEEEEEEEESLM